LWIVELDAKAESTPDAGFRAMARAMELWRWTLEYLRETKDPDGRKLFHPKRQGVSFAMADAVSWLMAARSLIMDVMEIKDSGPNNPVLAENLDGILDFYANLSFVQAARSASEAARICAELVYGYSEKVDVEKAREFERLRARADAAMAGARLAKEKASEHVTRIMIPEALDYPL
jgi:alkylation response protein AidB-like acyl-CoA dehydrogenase